MTLTDFLLARIAEDEKRANRFPDVLPHHPHEVRPPMMDAYGQPIIQPRRRLLAECEAKRGIVDRCERDMVADGESVSGYDIIAHTDALARDTLEFLALPYADHPDYRDEWKP